MPHGLLATYANKKHYSIGDNMYLLDTDLTVNWVFGAIPGEILLADLDVQITSPDNTVTYIDSAILAEDFLAPTDTSDGYASYTFTADATGLWLITLTTGTGAANDIYMETQIFVTINDTLTKKFIDGSLL